MNTPRIRLLRNACLLFLVLCTFAGPVFADYTVTGRFLYQDRAFDATGFTGTQAARPIRLADVQIIAGSTVVARGTTNNDGNFSIDVTGSTQQQIIVRCYASSVINGQTRDILLQVVNSYSTTATTTSFGSPWSVQATTNYIGLSPLTIGDVPALSNTDAGRAFNIWDALLDGVEFVNWVRGSNPSTLFTVAWSSSFQYFGGWYDNHDPARRFAYIGPTHAQDDPLIYQQFGHFLADLYSKLDAPIGFTVLSNDHQDIRAAWAEGLSLFLGASIRQYKGYSKPDYFMLTNGTAVQISFDLQSLSSYLNPQMTGYPPFKTNKGDTSILAVAAVLWNITNGPTMQRPFSDVWKVLDYLSRQNFQGFTAERFWDAWFSPAINNGFAAEMRGVFASQGMEFSPDAYDAQQPNDNAPSTAPTVNQATLPAAAQGVKVLINEISLDDGGAVELYNAGNIEANLEGWFLAVSRSSSTYTVTLPAVRLQPGQFVTFSGSTTTKGRDRILFPGTIPWQAAQEGACALLDSTNAARDFVRWGSSRYFPPGGTSFSGIATIPDPGTSIGRTFDSQDSDTGSDWTVQSSSLGTYNLNGEEKHHTFYPAGDVDYAAFNAKSSMWYLIEALDPANGADTVLEILSSDGTTVLAANDDSSLGPGSQVVWKPSSTGRYLIRCRRYDAATNYAQYGSYDLRILESSAPFFAGQPATLTVSKPGEGGRYNTIAEALADAYNGDIVEIIDSGTYLENLSIIGKSITLRAQRGKSPIIDGRGHSQVTLYLSGKDIRIDALTLYGGAVGIYIPAGSAKVTNTIISRTTEGSGADGVDVLNSGTSANFIHCTVSNNTRLGIGVFSNAKVRVSNSIVYKNGNNADIGGDSTAAAGLTVRNTISSNFNGSNGNSNSDPKFNAPPADYHLQSSSPAIDKGDATDPDEPARDADGLGRSLEGSPGASAVPDMGAYEYLSTSILNSTAVFPQIAVGGNPEYRTSIVAVNTGALTSTVRVSLTQSDGTPFGVKVLNDIGPRTMEGVAASAEPKPLYNQSGNSFDVAVMPSGTLRLETSGTNLLVGYAKLLSNLPLNGTAVFKTIQGSTITGEAGVGLSTPSTRFRVYIDNKSNARSGFAIANTGSVDAGVTMNLWNANGTQVDSKAITLPAGQHKAGFAHQNDYFPTTAGEDFEGMIEFVSSQPISAVALRYDNTHISGGEVFSTIPVLTDNDLATTLNFPQVADGGGYRTNFILVNPSGSSTIAKLEFYRDDGNPFQLSIGGTLRTSYDLPVPAHGVAHLLTDGIPTDVTVGWVKVTSTVAVGGSAIFQILNGTTINSEAGVAASPSASRQVVYVETVGSTFSGLAINNPNTSAVDVTLRLRNSSGVQVDTYSLQLLPMGHIAKFFTQWFGSYPDFEGTLEVVSSAPVSAVALRYDGNIFATLPVIMP